MAILKYNDVKVSGLSVCVPQNSVDNAEAGLSLFSEDELKKIIASIGVTSRRVTPAGICTSDLCFEAARTLLDELGVRPEEIGAVIFVTQTPDYRLPATACTLQHRLGLSKKSLAFDVNLGCSGYVYGLSLSFNLVKQLQGLKVLLLVGDTSSKCVSPHDKSSILLFGDAGSATLVESADADDPVFASLSSDGSGAGSLIIKGGGFRTPSSEETLKIIEYPDKNRRSLEHIFMDGAEIFNFTIREIPSDILEILKISGKRVEDVDLFFFHQANKFMIDFLAKKIKIPIDKYPLSLNTYGNTSSASIPLTMVTSRDRFAQGGLTVLLSGFGVGLSWGSILMNVSDCTVLPLKYI